jgi:hypothetical protein
MGRGAAREVNIGYTCQQFESVICEAKTSATSSTSVIRLRGSKSSNLSLLLLSATLQVRLGLGGPVSTANWGLVGQ